MVSTWCPNGGFSELNNKLGISWTEGGEEGFAMDLDKVFFSSAAGLSLFSF